MPQYPQDRLQTMNNAAKTIILTKIKPGTSVGIVEFNTKATVLSELTITTEADRKTLISRLPTVADGFTSIGAGILLGLEVRGCISLSYQIGFIFPLKISCVLFIFLYCRSVSKISYFNMIIEHNIIIIKYT